jgi:hypothetical protein
VLLGAAVLAAHTQRLGALLGIVVVVVGAGVLDEPQSAKFRRLPIPFRKRNGRRALRLCLCRYSPEEADWPVPHWDRIKAQLLDDFRAEKKAQIDDVLEASGVAELLREAEAIEEQAYEVHDQTVETPASTFGVLLWQLELARDFFDHDTLLDVIIAGVKRLAGSECNTELEELMKAERSPQNAGEPEEGGVA